LNEVVQFVGLGHRGGLPTDSSRGKGASPRRRMALGSELSLESFQERGPCRGGVGGPDGATLEIGVGTTLGGPVGDPLGAAVEGTALTVGTELGATVGRTLGIGTTLGGAVGDRLGAPVGVSFEGTAPTVGTKLGATVGRTLGIAVGRTLGKLRGPLRASLGGTVGNTLGAALGRSKVATIDRNSGVTVGRTRGGHCWWDGPHSGALSWTPWLARHWG
jgi:hypothetical protein